MTTYELEMKFQLNHGNGYVEEEKAHFCATSFLSLFKKFDKLVNQYSSDWFITVYFYKIENLRVYKVEESEIVVNNEDDRLMISYFTTCGQAPFDA